MIQLTLNEGKDRPEGHVPWTANIRRGFDPGDTDDVLFEKNRGAWSLNPKRADTEDFVLVTFKKHIVGVWKVEGVRPVGYRAEHWGQDNRFYFKGYALTRGDALYDRLVGRDSLLQTGSQNPIQYVPAELLP